MESIHPLISAGHGTKEEPFVLNEPEHLNELGYTTNATFNAVQEIIDTIFGSKFRDRAWRLANQKDFIFIINYDYDECLWPARVRDVNGLHTIWFDLKACISAPPEVIRDIFEK